eukprot:gene11465-4629_t
MSGQVKLQLIEIWSPQPNKILRVNSNETQIISANIDITVSNFETLKTEILLKGHEKEVTELLFSKDGFLISASKDGTIRIWSTDPKTGGEIKKINVNKEGVACMTYLKNSDTIIASGRDNILRQFSMKGKLISETKANMISELEPSDDEFFVSGDFQGYIKMWSSKTFEEISSVSAHDGKITGMSISADYSLIATLSNDGAFVLTDSNPLMVLMYAYAKHDNSKSGLFYSPKEVFLIFSQTDSNISLYNLETKKVAFSLILPSTVLSLNWSLSGNRIHVGCGDNHIRIYEIVEE